MPPTAMINPAFTALGDGMEEDWEGCLSIPGLRGRVARHRAIDITLAGDTIASPACGRGQGEGQREHPTPPPRLTPSRPAITVPPIVRMTMRSLLIVSLAPGPGRG